MPPPPARTKFPAGCPVYFHFRCASAAALIAREGVVASVAVDAGEGRCEFWIELRQRDSACGGTPPSLVVGEDDIAYAVDCPVLLAVGDDQEVEGKVLFVKPTTDDAGYVTGMSYVVQHALEEHQVRMEEGVTPDRLSFRQAKGISAPVAVDCGHSDETAHDGSASSTDLVSLSAETEGGAGLSRALSVSCTSGGNHSANRSLNTTETKETTEGDMEKVTSSNKSPQEEATVHDSQQIGSTHNADLAGARRVSREVIENMDEAFFSGARCWRRLTAEAEGPGAAPRARHTALPSSHPDSVSTLGSRGVSPSVSAKTPGAAPRLRHTALPTFFNDSASTLGSRGVSTFASRGSSTFGRRGSKVRREIASGSNEAVCGFHDSVSDLGSRGVSTFAKRGSSTFGRRESKVRREDASGSGACGFNDSVSDLGFRGASTFARRESCSRRRETNDSGEATCGYNDSVSTLGNDGDTFGCRGSETTSVSEGTVTTSNRRSSRGGGGTLQRSVQPTNVSNQDDSSDCESGCDLYDFTTYLHTEDSTTYLHTEDSSDDEEAAEHTKGTPSNDTSRLSVGVFQDWPNSIPGASDNDKGSYQSFRTLTAPSLDNNCTHGEHRGRELHVVEEIAPEMSSTDISPANSLRHSEPMQDHGSPERPLSRSMGALSISAPQDSDGDKEYAGKEEAGGTASKNNPASTALKQRGTDTFWNRLKTAVAVTRPKPPKKEIDSATCFQCGKRKAAKGQFRDAVTLFNFALDKQREELGEDHVDCGVTLNEIGVCCTMLGERDHALKAFQEALYVREQNFGVEAMEVAETKNNIRMLLQGCNEETLMSYWF